ncbi:3-oxoacyl-[acyl-carrier-protein] synthase-3 [Peptoniphilus asaccharolyticus DSM 20463]|uniref:3-oxoacyl-[acyl-carrier-protein] synthase-3 n=1 Tax=Peptoniphilus asaccharolyticus DSM 20463 TaxID=573058 RepID=A0A1W1UX81_PEPAS|nr:beta-ketoacyl-ACP synthase 3 [Peptoniphilus asaccharolyticus]MBL7575309.1 beta-ketoacyl-ACP synthase 3 [Peptoniphilus asaccharolyticus]SMB85768.1 3-oxoacyl-[acyl-carrier-protein] synthase-3 [Peptoniphilus asaccharolyticus DSM 20463]
MGLKFLDIKKIDLENKIENEYFTKILDTSDEWIKSRTGISSRYFAKESVSDMAVELANKLNFDREKIRLVLVASFTSERILPSVAGLINEKLNLNENCLSADINMACTGFVGAMILAERFLRDGECAILIAAEKISSVLDFSDRTTSVLFGDGCAGVVVEKNNKLWVTDEKTYGDEKALSMRKGEFVSMQGKDVYRFAVDKVPKSIEKLFEESGIEKEDIDHVFAHQANIRILDQISSKLDLDIDKFMVNVDKHGNTSAASVPILLAEKKEFLKDGDKVIFSAFGAGLSICSVLMEW